jgi:hypothetical protein
MCRFLASVSSIFILLITTFLLPHSASARLCEERMPLTLLALYRTSDSIYIGRYEKSEDSEATEDTADYSVIPVKKYFSISSAIKGETRKSLVLEETEYRYKSTEDVDEEAEHGDGEIPADAIPQPGDPVLLFVSRNEESGVLELTEMSDGIKKMTPEKLSAYEARLRELKSILAPEKPKYSEIIDWLIRCAEDPLTRWEGTFELLQSFQNMEWQDERAKQAKENRAVGEENGSDEYEPEAPKEFETGDVNFAKNVTDAQKQVLTNILLSRERPKKTENGEPQDLRASGDRELIELVKRWGDSRVAANLLETLKQGPADPNQNSELMASIASMLDDEELTSVSDEYSNIQWEADEAVIAGGPEAPAEMLPADISESADPVSPRVENLSAVIGPELPPMTIETDASEEPIKWDTVRKTYGALRAELMTKFLARADLVIEKELNKNSARLTR